MIPHSSHSLTVLCEYEGAEAGFAGRLIRAESLDSAQEIVTFDLKFGRLPNVQKIQCS